MATAKKTSVKRKKAPTKVQGTKTIKVPKVGKTVEGGY